MFPQDTFDKVKLIVKPLMRWAAGNLRTFPWRETSDPYELLIAEVLLRRTNARAVQPVYENLLSIYPTLKSFSRADPEQLKMIAHSLGLTWRSENLIDLSSRFIQERNVPVDLEGLLSLPGVGPYVARAVLVNAYDSRTVAIDSNVVRVISRFVGIRMSDGLRRNRAFQELCDSAVPEDKPRIFNYAILDLAASICRPAAPKCCECPLKDQCSFAHEG